MQTYIQWVFIKHLLCARRHCVPLWVKARGRLSRGSTESHMHSGKASTMSPPSKQRTAWIQSTMASTGNVSGSSFSSEWQPLSFCFRTAMGMFGTVKSYRGLKQMLVATTAHWGRQCVMAEVAAEPHPSLSSQRRHRCTTLDLPTLDLRVPLHQGCPNGLLCPWHVPRLR